jgi:predicted TIM-barrel fold metal-dependent hydrolase
MTLIKCDKLDLAPAAAPCGCGMNHAVPARGALSLPRRKLLWGSAAGVLAAGVLSTSRSADAQTTASGAGKAADRIDVHHHYTSPALLAMMKGRRTGQVFNEGWTLQKSLDAMDAAGIKTAVVSTSDPGVFFGDYDQARWLARNCNEYQAKMVADNPGRFGMFVTLPMPDVDNTLAEIAYGLDVLKADGVGFMTSYGTQYLGDPAFTPVWEELNRRKAVVFVHPLEPACCTNVVPNVPDVVVEYGNETSRTIASLLFSGTTAKFPNIRFIFSHGGGTVPYLITRFQRAYAGSPQMMQLSPGGAVPAIRKLYFDTAMVWNPDSLAALTRLMPTDHILLGTDFPAGSPILTVKGLKDFGLSPAALRAIERDNAISLMPTVA